MISLHSVEQMVNYMEILLHLYYVEGKGVFYLSYFLYLEQFDCSQHRWDVYGKDFVSNLLCFSCFSQSNLPYCNVARIAKNS